MAIDPNHTAARPLRPIAPAPPPPAPPAPPPPHLYTVPIRAQSSPAAAAAVAVVYPGRSPYPSGPPPLNFHSQPHPYPHLHPPPPPAPAPAHSTAPAYNLHQSPLSPPLKVSSTPEVRFSVSRSLPPSLPRSFLFCFYSGFLVMNLFSFWHSFFCSTHTKLIISLL